MIRNEVLATYIKLEQAIRACDAGDSDVSAQDIITSMNTIIKLAEQVKAECAK